MISYIRTRSQGEEQFPYRAVAKALEVIPRTLSQNCGANTIRTLTELRAKHTQENGKTFGVNGTSGKITDMNELGVWEPLSVKVQGMFIQLVIRILY